MPILRSLINLAYPPACLLCQASLTSGEALLCPTCERPLRQVDDSVRRVTPDASVRSWAPWRHVGTARRLVHQVKYHRRWRLGRLAAAEMTRLAGRALPVQEIDVVAPVPSHWLRRRLRGFTAAELLGRHVALGLRRPYAASALRRTRWTPSQTRLRGTARRRNVLAAFRAEPGRVAGRTVLLVDDVLTTGSTARQCARALTKAGASRVFVLTAARSPRK